MVHIEYNGWQQYTQQQTFHTTPPRGRGGGGVAVILLLLKHVEEKQHIVLLQREEKIRMMVGSNTPPTNWKLGPLSFNQHFIFFYFLSSHLPFPPPTTVAQNSCPAITTQPTPPFLRLSYPAHPLTPTLSISSSYISALMVLLSTFIHLKWIPHSCKTHIFGCLETVMPLFHGLSCLMFCLVPCGFR